MLHTDGPAAPTPQLHPSPSQRSPWKPHSCPRAKAHAHADTVRGSQTLKTPEPLGPRLGRLWSGPRGTAWLLDHAHEYDSSWAFVRRGAAESSSLSRSASALCRARCGTGVDFHAQRPLRHTQALESVGLLHRPGDTEGGQGSQHGGCRRSLLPAPVPRHTSVGPQ